MLRNKNDCEIDVKNVFFSVPMPVYESLFFVILILAAAATQT